MKVCLHCRKTYDNDLPECPFCGYKPRSKAMTKSIQVTQEFDIAEDTKTFKRNKKKSSKSDSTKDVYASSGDSEIFYLRSGKRLNKRYSITSVIGFGRFGVAYECFDEFTQKNVVVKEFMPSYLATRSRNGREVEPLSEDSEVEFSIRKDSFIDENNKLNSNDVKAVPKLVECFEQNNTAYVVTELIRGEALSSILKRKGKLTYDSTITIITGVLQGLRQLNKLGVIHGDLCPENIIVTSESRIYLLDYNLSEFNKNVYTQRDAGKLRVGYSALEMYYMNMEQGPWTDVYAAAATMYKMLTGISVPSAIKRNTSDSLTSLYKLGIPITPGAEKAMFKALKVDYTKRTQHPEDFLNGLMGDGFDNISVDKDISEDTPSDQPPRRPTVPKKVSPKKSNFGNIGNKILKKILIFLVLAIIAVIIWCFISGVFAMPSAISDKLSLGGNDDTDISNSFSIESESDESSDVTIPKDFYKRDNSSLEEDTSSDEATSSGNFVDNIISNVKDYVTDEIESRINFFGSSEESEESYVYDDDNNYYSDDNYYSEDDYSYPDNDQYYYDNGYYDDNGNYNEYYDSEQIESPVSSEETSSQTSPLDFVNSMVDMFRQ